MPTPGSSQIIHHPSSWHLPHSPPEPLPSNPLLLSISSYPRRLSGTHELPCASQWDPLLRLMHQNTSVNPARRLSFHALGMPMPDSIEMVQNRPSALWIWMTPLPIVGEKQGSFRANHCGGLSDPLARFPKQQNAQAPGLSDPLPGLGMYESCVCPSFLRDCKPFTVRTVSFQLGKPVSYVNRVTKALYSGACVFCFANPKRDMRRGSLRPPSHLPFCLRMSSTPKNLPA